MPSRPAARGAHLFGLAMGGVLAGHALTYGVLDPSEPSRRSALASTGHGYLATANRLALSLTVAVVAASVLARLVRGDDAERGVGWLAARLIPVQVVAFASLEVAERLLAGAPLHDLGPVLPLGLAIQVSLAILAAAGLRLLWRTAASAAASLGGGAAPAPRRPLLLRATAPTVRVRVRILDARRPARAPPLPA